MLLQSCVRVEKLESWLWHIYTTAMPTYLEILLLNVLHLLGTEESLHVALVAIHAQDVQPPQRRHLSHDALNTGIDIRARHASKLTSIDRKQKGGTVELSNTHRLQQQIVVSSAVV